MNVGVKRQKLARKLSGKKELKRASLCIVQMLWQYIMTFWIVRGSRRGAIVYTAN